MVSAIERRIINKLLDAIFAAGHGVGVSYEDDCDFAVYPTDDREAIWAEIGACDTTTLRIDDHLGWIYLVHGNDEDVICDCSDNEITRTIVDSIDVEAEVKTQTILNHLDAIRELLK